MGLKQTKLNVIFIEYLLSLFAGIVVLATSFVVLFYFLIFIGVVVPSNYTESLIRDSRQSIEEAPKITKEILPLGCEYAIYDKNGRYLSGSINQENATMVWKQVKIENNTGSLKHYALIEGKNEFCILQYYLLPQFKSSILRSKLPNPQYIWIISFAFTIIIEIILLSLLFGRKINKKLTLLKDVAIKIQEMDLDFNVKYSGVKEIDDVLSSLDNLKNELRNSLKEQWNIEQSKKEQISALAHDIKTPLTIIKGNSELLIDSNNNEEKEYINFIAKSVKQIEDYIKTLIEISNTENSLTIQLSSVNSHEFVTSIYSQLKALANRKKITVDFLESDLPEKFNIDRLLLNRAIMNVISNAIEHCPDAGKIVFEVQIENINVSFKISDSGKGFSNKDIKFATKQFYMGDHSRALNAHYGMGLYITQNIINQHNGSLNITNSKSSGGGEVTIWVPI